MKKLTTRFFVLLLALSWAADGRAFSLLGPFKTYQVQGIGYNLPGDLGGPMTLSEGYRWNVRTVTYALDQSFIEYFGSNGIAAIDAAMKIFNDLPDYNQITNDGSSLYIRGQRIPTDTKRTKYEAQALGLIDVKSSVLPLILEEVGLAAAERWIFALRARTVTTVNGVTRTNYSVVKENFDPITLQSSSYVDGVLYTYTVQEFMGPPVDFADAIEQVALTDATFPFSSVSGGSG